MYNILYQLREAYKSMKATAFLADRPLLLVAHQLQWLPRRKYKPTNRPFLSPGWLSGLLKKEAATCRVTWWTVTYLYHYISFYIIYAFLSLLIPRNDMVVLYWKILVY